MYISEDIGVIMSMCGIWYMATIYVRSQPNIAKLLKDLSNFDKFGTPPNFEKLNKRLNIWSWFAFMYPTLGSTSINLTKFLMKSDCEEINRKEHLNEKCGLMYPFWIPFEINYFPVFQLVFLYVWISVMLLVRLHLSLCFQAVEITQHIILRIKHLSSLVVESFDNYDGENCSEKIKNCIIYHQEILE